MKIQELLQWQRCVGESRGLNQCLLLSWSLLAVVSLVLPTCKHGKKIHSKVGTDLIWPTAGKQFTFAGQGQMCWEAPSFLGDALSRLPKCLDVAASQRTIVWTSKSRLREYGHILYHCLFEDYQNIRLSFAETALVFCRIRKWTLNLQETTRSSRRRLEEVSSTVSSAVASLTDFLVLLRLLRLLRLPLRPRPIAHLRACRQRRASQANNRVVVLISARLSNCQSSLASLQSLPFPFNTHRRVSIIDSVGEGDHIELWATSACLESPVLMTSHIHRNRRVFGDQSPSKDSICREVGIADDANVACATGAGDFFGMDAVPENDPIFFHLRSFQLEVGTDRTRWLTQTYRRSHASLVPTDIILRHNTPGTVSMAVDISARNSKSDCCGTRRGRQVANVVGLFKIVPGYDFDNVRLHSANGLLPAVRKEDVWVFDPGVVIAVIEIFELPGRDACVHIHMVRVLR